MEKFNGFPVGSKLSPTAFPALFFTDLLPMIDNLAELKVTLFCFWALHQKEGRFRYLRHRDFGENEALLEGLRQACPDMQVDAALEQALVRAMERGTLLAVEVTLDSGAEPLYFVNTALGRTAVEQIGAGLWQPCDNPTNPVEILPERPNIYRLYESNIGALTPRIADHLKDAERDYPVAWVEEAIHLAVDGNKRNWRYIQAILKRWQAEGKDGGITGRSSGQDGKVYTAGKYADFIKS